MIALGDFLFYLFAAMAELEDRIAGNRGYLLARACAWLGSRADAEDLVQHTIERALRCRLQFADRGDPDRDLRGWLCTMMKRERLDQTRDQLAQKRTPPTWWQPRASTPATQEIVVLISEVLALVTPGQQRVLVAVAQGATCEDVAARLGLALGTVKSRLARARERMERA